MEIGARRCGLWGGGVRVWEGDGRRGRGRGEGLSTSSRSHSALCWPRREPAARRPGWGRQQPFPRGVHCGLSPEWGHAAPGLPG